MRFTPRRLLALGAQLVLVIILLLALERYMTRHAVRGAAPLLATTLTDGTPFSLDSLRGKPVLVYFWAPWCPSCAALRATIDGLARDGVALVTVAMQAGSVGTIRDYQIEHDLNWRVIDDADGAIARRWGARAIPAVYILDRDGEIRFVTRGYTTTWGLRTRLWLARP